MPHRIADADFYRGLGRHFAAGIGLDRDVKVQPLEMRRESAGDTLHQQIERGFGRLELVAGVFHLHDLVQNLLRSARSFCRLCFRGQAP